MSPGPYLKLISRLEQNANWVCKMCVCVYWGQLFLSTFYSEIILSRDGWKSLLGAGVGRRFQYLSPFQNRVKTRPLKEAVKRTKLEELNVADCWGILFGLCFVLASLSIWSDLKKMKLFSLCWKKKKIDPKHFALSWTEIFFSWIFRWAIKPNQIWRVTISSIQPER